MEIISRQDLKDEYRGVYGQKLIVKGQASDVIYLRNLLYTTVPSYAVAVCCQERNDNDLTVKTCDLCLELGLTPVIHKKLDKRYRYRINNSDEKEYEYYCRLYKNCENQEFMDVTSDDIELIDINHKPLNIFPFLKGYMYTQLKKGQILDMILYIRKSNGSKTHFKHCPGFLTSMVEINKNILDDDEKKAREYKIKIESFGQYDAPILVDKLLKIYQEKTQG